MDTSSGIGLAAPQVGLKKNFFIMNTHGKKRCVINPVIVDVSKSTSVFIEGCLSFPNQRRAIKRAIQITVMYQNENDEYITEILDGLAARCFLHEIDHLRGRVFTEYETERSY